MKKKKEFGLMEQSLKTTHEINSNSGNIGLSVCVISKSEQETRLSNTGVSDKEKLEEIIAARKNTKASELRRI